MKTRLSVLHINTSSERIGESSRKQVCFDSSRNIGIEFIDFPISFAASPESKLHLLHSFASTPARYIEAVVARGIELGIQGNFLVLNPLMKFDSELYDFVISAVAEMDGDDIAVVASLKDQPLGYFFGSAVIGSFFLEKLFRLRFLSALSATLDVTYLQAAFDSKPRLLVSSIQVELDRDSGFYLDGFQGIYTLAALHAKAAFHRSADQLPLLRLAVMPYHAGDILFFLKATENVTHPFNAILIHEEFLPIVQKMRTELEVIIIKESSIRRGPNVDPALTTHENREELFFFNVIYPHISRDTLFYWFRPSRDYNLSKSHMIDQWKSSLTNNAFTPVREEKRVGSQKTAASGKSALLHFDGGWPLKVYPANAQMKLIELLKIRGYRVSVLTDKPVGYKCEVFPFENLAKLEKNILAHAIFVGMDSFPAHFATHVFKHPTICLYSSTRPDNSNASVFDGYRFMQSDLTCAPCHGDDICPRFSKNFCENFSKPESVAAAIDEMFRRCYGEFIQ